jgi:hypothetical protein
MKHLPCLPIALFSLAALLLWSACKSKPTEPGSSYISVRSLILNDVADVDTSLYPIVRITQTDSLPADTQFVHRESFRQIASDFLDIPDLSDPGVANRYHQDSARYDEQLGKVILTYRAAQPEKEETRLQEILIQPDPANGDKVTSIYIEREISNRDSLWKRKLLWKVNKSFQVVSVKQFPGQPEVTTITRVRWNEPETP